MRRSRLVFEKAFKDADIRLVYCSSAAEGFTPAKWWANSHGFKTVCSEYIKLIGYFVPGKLKKSKCLDACVKPGQGLTI
jgi:hypothetical protein